MPSSLIALAAARHRTVDIDGTAVSVRGISAREIAVLAARYDEIRAVLSGGEVSLSTEALIDLGPDVVAAIIAAGTGGIVRDERGHYALDDEAISVASTLGLGAQILLLDAILSETFPGADGPRPFVAAAVRWLNIFGAAISSEAPAVPAQAAS